MPDIKQLPPSVINKIAAGEVIERPASVVKELMENSVDAGARRVDVTIEKGGTELVRVADDGCGIAQDQAPLAIASHATSKIRNADDLFHVQSLGFRGEALASIAEVSRFLLRTRTGDEQGGIELQVDGGVAEPPAPCGCPVGTIIEVRQLFYNTPVRRKFLRTTQTEMGHVIEAFTRIALVHLDVHFTLRHGDRTVHDLPPTERWRERITAFFGDDIGDSLISIGGDDGTVKLRGYVADPTHSRANNRMQYLFLNGRHIRDRALQHAMGEAYRGLLLTGRYPIAFLRLDIPPEAVDVNVHPTKLEVRFQDSGRIYSQLLGTLRKKFLSTDLTARVQPAPSDASDSAAAAHDSTQTQRHREELVNWAKGQLSGPDREATELPPTGTAAGMTASGESEAVRPEQRRMEWERSGPSAPPFKPFPDYSQIGAPARPPSAPPEENDLSLPSPATAPLGPSVANSGIQVHNRYLITENQEGVVIIDQHALHERILYEQLREKVLGGKLERQRLLVPETVTLTPSEAAAALDAKETFAEIGIEIEPFGGDTVLVSTYPAMLANFDPITVVRELVEQLVSHGKTPGRREVLDDLLHMISCKAAIKAGDRLTPEEVTALLEQRHEYQDTHHCPHGRPTSLVFSKDELDKRFKRT